jgi:hypothetical protein
MLTGNQLQEKLRAWLSPPNPIINHNMACSAQHRGTARWFIEGSRFQEWKENGSALWIRGNRMFLPPLLPILFVFVDFLSPIPQRGQGKLSFGTWFLV